MVGTTRPGGRSARRLVLATVASALVTLSAALVTTGAADATHRTWINPIVRTPRSVGGCTMAAPAPHATIEAQIANAADFCDLVAQGLADEVFGAVVTVTPDRLWHYTDAALSCRLRYRQTAGRMTVRNSAAACRWFSRAATGWRRTAPSPVYLS